MPQITFNSTKICIDTDSNSQLRLIIYEAIESLIDNIKHQMREIWMKQFEQQIDRSRNYFPPSESTFSKELGFQQNRNTRDIYLISKEIETLRTFGILTKSITIEGLSNITEMKMTVTKDANRLENGWTYHCATTEAQIETNTLKGQLVWNYDNNLLKKDFITFHLNGFKLKFTGSGLLFIDLGEIQIDSTSSYCLCSKELLHNIFANQLKSVIIASIRDHFNIIYQNRNQQLEDPETNIPQMEEWDMNNLAEGSGY